MTSGQAANYLQGPAISISTLKDLGKKRISFPSYEKVIHLNEDIQSEASKPILSTKERFLQLEKDRHKIMDEHLGLALSYYYYAIQASNKRRFAEVVIDLAIAAEALFSKETPYTSNLKCRLSLFIADDELERKNIAKKIGDFYSIRGAIVHGETREIPLDEVRIAWEYIKKAIDKALTSGLYTKAELIQKVDKR